MIKCSVIGCWNPAPNKTGLCTEHRPAPAPARNTLAEVGEAA
jgi:hypothetical protein